MPKIFSATFLEDGKETSRDFFLPDAKSVRAAIKHTDGIPLSIREKTYQWWQREWVGKDYKIRFLRSICLHTSAGLSPENALMLVIESETHTARRNEIQPALEVLRGGGSFPEAIEHLRMFDQTIVAVLSAGEKAGFIREAIDLSVQHLEQKKKNWKILTGGLSALSFDIFMSVSSVAGMQYKFIPWLAEKGIQSSDAAALKHFADELNTVKNINSGLFIITILFCLAIVGIAAAFFSKNKSVSGFSERIAGRIPVVRSFIYDGAMGETFGLAGRMLKGRLRLDMIFKLVSSSSIVPAVLRLW